MGKGVFWNGHELEFREILVLEFHGIAYFDTQLKFSIKKNKVCKILNYHIKNIFIPLYIFSIYVYLINTFIQTIFVLLKLTI